MIYYKAMLSLIWIVSCISIADALLRPEEFSFMFLVYTAFITNTALVTKKNHIICLLDYVCLHLLCGREETQGTKDSSSWTCWQLRGKTWCSAPCRPCQHWAESMSPCSHTALLGWPGLMKGQEVAVLSGGCPGCPCTARTHRWPAATGSFANHCPSAPKRDLSKLHPVVLLAYFLLDNLEMSLSCLYNMMLWGNISVGNMLGFFTAFLVLFFKVSLQYFPFSGCLLYKLLQKNCFPMWLVTIILPNTVIWTKPSFAVRDYLPWGQRNNMYSSQHTSLGMICILDRNISLSPCSRIASRKVLLVLNYLFCCDKITRLCESWVYGRLANPHLQPAWILLLTYTINSEETSQTLCSPGGWGYAAACMTDGKAA